MKRKIMILMASLFLVVVAFFVAQKQTTIETESNGYEPEAKGDFIFSILK